MNITYLLLDWNRKNRYSVALYAICQPNTNVWPVTHKQCCCYHHMEWPREHSEVKALEQGRTWVASSLQCTSGVLVWQITNCDQSSPMLKQQLTELRIQQWLKTTTATRIAHAFFHWPPKTSFPSLSSKHFVVSWIRNRLTMKSRKFLMKLSKWNLSNGAWFPPLPRHVLDLLEQLRRTGWHTQPDEDQRTPGSSCSFSSSKKIIVPLH